MWWVPRVLLAALAGLLSAVLVFPIMATTYEIIGKVWVTLAVATLWFFSTYVFVACLYGRLIRIDSETRCRKCRYILRGISQPRCPECGERI